MPSRPSPFATLTVPDEDQLLAALREAVSVGRNDPLFRDEDAERIDSPVRHMALASTRMVDVALAAQLIQTHFPSGATTPDDVLSRGIAWSLRAALAGTIRLTWRALELDGCHTGYDVAAWEFEAAYGAQAVVVVAVDAEPTNLPPTPLQETRDAGR